MSRHDAISALLALACFALVLVLALQGDSGGAPPASRRLVWELAPASHMEVKVPAGTEELRLVTSRQFPADRSSPLHRWMETRLQLSWLDPEGRVVEERELVERSRRSFSLDWGLGALRASALSGPGLYPGDSRVSWLPAAALLPAGGQLSLGVAEGDPPVWLRVLGRASDRDPGAGASLAQRAAVARRLGLELPLLDEVEWERVGPQRWLKLQPVGRPEVDYHQRWMGSQDLELSAEAVQTQAQQLEAGRSLAVNLRGPVRLLLSGPAAIQQLEGRWWTDGGSAPPPALPAEPLPFVGATHGLIYEVAEEVVASLHLHNPSGAEVGPLVLSMASAGPERLWGQTVAVSVEQLARVMPAPLRQRLEQEQVSLLGPELQSWRGFELGPEGLALPTGGLPANHRLELRPLLEGPEDRAPRRVWVEALDAEGRLRWSEEGEVPAEPAPFDHLLEDPLASAPRSSSWVGETRRLDLVSGPEVERLVLRAEDPLLVMVRAPGALQGAPDVAPLRSPDRVLRHIADQPRPWRPVPLTGVAREGRVLVHVRLEAAPAKAAAGGAPRYQSLEPRDAGLRARARTWLVPRRPGAAAGVWYCRYSPGDGEAPFSWGEVARRQLEGELKGVLWASPSRLGQPWALLLGGRAAAGGRLLQATTRFSLPRQPAQGQVRLEAPPGSTLWLRTWGSGVEGCPAAHRPVEAWPLEPGQSLRLRVDKAEGLQRLLLGGLAASAASLEVQIPGLEGLRQEGVHRASTLPQQLLQLLPLAEHPALLLEDPDQRLLPLDPVVVILGEDLPPGPLEVALTSTSSSRLWLRAGLELPASAPMEPERPFPPAEISYP